MAKMKTGCVILVACALVVGTSLVRLIFLFTNTLEVTLLEFRQTVRNSALVFVRFMRSGASSVYFVFLEMQNCFRSTSATVDFFFFEITFKQVNQFVLNTGRLSGSCSGLQLHF